MSTEQTAAERGARGLSAGTWLHVDYAGETTETTPVSRQSIAAAVLREIGIDPDGPADPVAAGVAEERRACADEAENVGIESHALGHPIEANGAFIVAERIRSRGEAQ